MQIDLILSFWTQEGIFFFTLYSRLHENEVVEASAPIYCLVCAISKIDTEKLDGISFFQVA